MSTVIFRHDLREIRRETLGEFHNREIPIRFYQPYDSFSLLIVHNSIIYSLADINESASSSCYLEMNLEKLEKQFCRFPTPTNTRRLLKLRWASGANGDLIGAHSLSVPWRLNNMAQCPVEHKWPMYTPDFKLVKKLIKMTGITNEK